jgi:hypothetical protein
VPDGHCKFWVVSQLQHRDGGRSQHRGSRLTGHATKVIANISRRNRR